jgi:arsenate reductase
VDVIVRAFHYAFVVLNRRIGLFLSLLLSTVDQLAIKREVENISRS